MSAKMNFAVCIGIFISISDAVLVKGLSPFVFHDTNVNKILLDYLTSDDMVNAANPAANAACFAKYLPILAEIGNTYSTQYQACIKQAEMDTTNLIANASTDHNNFVTTTSSLCTAYQKCNTDVDILQFFDCYASVSTDDVSVLYNLSANATSAAATLNAGMRVVQDERSQCINTTEKTYVQNTAATYELLNECLEKADSSTAPPPTFPPVNGTALKRTFIVKKDSFRGSQRRIKISSDEFQKGSGSQTQNADSSSNASQNRLQSGDGSYFQCSGVNCSKRK